LKFFSDPNPIGSDNNHMTLLMHETCDDVQMTTANAERRRGLRIRQARPVKVFEVGGVKYFGGQTEDISATGLRIDLPASAPLVPGSLISVLVGLNREGGTLPNRRQLIPARVVWVDRSFARGFAVAGVEFITSIAAHLDAA
jgi:hypothetical protein